MAKLLLLLPEAVREAIARRYQRGRHGWLAGEGEWPMDLPLGSPDEREAQRQPEAVRAWIAAWTAWSGAGELVWRELQQGTCTNSYEAQRNAMIEQRKSRRRKIRSNPHY